jgi:hypothetical protein
MLALICVPCSSPCTPLLTSSDFPCPVLSEFTLSPRLSYQTFGDLHHTRDSAFDNLPVQQGYGASHLPASSQRTYTNGGQPPPGRPVHGGPMFDGGLPAGLGPEQPQRPAAYVSGAAPMAPMAAPDAPLATADLLHPYGAAMPHGHMHGIAANGAGAAMHAPQAIDGLGRMNSGTPLPSTGLGHPSQAAPRPHH